MYLKKSPRFKHLLDKEMKVRKELRNMEDRMKMYTIYLIGVAEGEN